MLFNELKSAEANLEKQKEILDNYSSFGKSRYTELVINGHARFSDLGKAITKRSLEVEENLTGKTFARFSKWDVLGTPITKEANDYLVEQEILNPADYFSSRAIMPLTLRNILTADPFSSASALFISAFTVCEAVGFSFMEKLKDPTSILITSAALYLPCLFSPIIFGVDGVDGLSNERQNFSNALNYLDNTVKSIYPTDRITINPS